MQHDIYALLGMTACGVALSVLFDARRGFERAAAPPDIFVIIGDALFWIAAAAAAVWCLWKFNSGAVRAYEIVGCVAGSVLYFLTLSPVVLKAFTFIDGKILKIITFIFKILLTPVRFLYKIIMIYTSGSNAMKKERDTGHE